MLTVLRMRKMIHNTAARSLTSAATAQYDAAVASREPITALGGSSRASRIALVSIQRLAPSVPPVISAVNVQIVQ